MSCGSTQKASVRRCDARKPLCPCMCRLQPSGVGGADQRVGSSKKEGVSTGSVSAFGRAGTGHRSCCAISWIGSGRGDPQDAVVISSAQAVSLAVGVILSSPIVGLHGGDVGKVAGIDECLRRADARKVCLMHGSFLRQLRARRISLAGEKPVLHAKSGNEGEGGDPQMRREAREQHRDHNPFRHSLRSASRRLTRPCTRLPPAYTHSKNASQPPRQSPALKRRATVERAKAAAPIL